ncbi:MAG: hypothetical protein IJA62_06520 [Ruminococcus sp.]|nr:hypothetical protein [Ruminococcus sp.]
MKKLYLKRDASQVHSRFLVFDDLGREKFVITGRRMHSSDKMVISDLCGNPLVHIRVAPFHVFYAFSVRVSTERFTMVASTNAGKADFRFHGISWLLSRSSDLRSFEIFDADGSLVMSQSADSYLTNGSYTLEIYSELRELFCIAAAVCADVINYADNSVKATT